MPRALGAIFLIVVGAIVLAVAWRGFVTGEVRAGNSGLRPYRPNHNDNPLAFWFFVVLYYCGGMALTVWGILALLGLAPALILR